MLVSGINRILNWRQVIFCGRRYTCPTKMIDGKLFFRFKRSGIVLRSSAPTMLRDWYLKVEKYFQDLSKNKVILTEVQFMRCANCGNEDENALWN